MRRTNYEDGKGRKWAVMLPDDAPDADAPMGLPVGPPSLDSLDLPEEIEVRLHNALFDRGLLTARDVRARRREVLGALISALKLGVSRITALYQEGQENGRIARLRSKPRNQPKPSQKRPNGLKGGRKR